MLNTIHNKLFIKNKHKPHKHFMKSLWNQINTHSRPLAYSRKFQFYLDEITSITGIEILPKQRQLLKQAIETNEYHKLSTAETRQRRVQFTRIKDKLIEDWELNTGSKWHTYPKNVVNSHGKILRLKGKKWDAHEIILNSWGSPHEWWNLHPCPHPEHQRDVHGKNSICSQIFEKGEV